MVLIMNYKKLFLSFVSIVFMITLFSNFTFAQQNQDYLGDLFKTLEDFDVVGSYEKYSFIIDSLIYFLFFLSLSQVTLGKQYQGGGGKGIVIAVGIALSVGISFWTQKNGITLGNLGPLAAVLAGIVFIIWIFRS